MTTPKSRFALRFHSEKLYDDVKAEAEKEMRSINTVINIAIREYLKHPKK